jgi:hypothetical protein
MDDLLNVGKAGTTRRGLLSTNIKAIAVIAAGALVTRLTPAKADPGQNNNGGNGNGNGNGGHGQKSVLFEGNENTDRGRRAPRRRSGCW